MCLNCWTYLLHRDKICVKHGGNWSHMTDHSNCHLSTDGHNLHDWPILPTEVDQQPSWWRSLLQHTINMQTKAQPIRGHCFKIIQNIFCSVPTEVRKMFSPLKFPDYKIITWRAICENIVALRCFIIYSNPDISGHTCPGMLKKTQSLDLCFCFYPCVCLRVLFFLLISASIWTDTYFMVKCSRQ